MSKEIEAQSRVLESGDEALIQGSEPSAAPQEGEEFVSLDDLEKPEQSEPAPAPAAPAAQAGKQKPAAAAPAEEDDIPAEYKGKSMKDIIKMHREAASTIGRQGSELGDLRKRIDFAVQASLAAIQARKAEQQPAPAAPAQPAEVEFDESELFSKPKETINKLIASHPVLKQLNETLGRAAAEQAASRAQAASERFNQAHPDASTILRDTEFRQWVAASPIRKNLLLRANNAFDFHAGDEIFSTWKALKGVKTSAPVAPAAPAAPAVDPVSEAARVLAQAKAAKATAAAQTAAAQAAAVPTGGSSSGGKGAGKKLYRRSEIVHLMETDPDKYERLSDEIALAYAEGRVR